MARETLMFTLPLDTVGDLDVEGEAVLVWQDGSDNPAENGWVCDRVRFVRAVLHEEDGVSRSVTEESARALCAWDNRNLDALMDAEGDDAAERLWGEGPRAFAEEWDDAA